MLKYLSAICLVMTLLVPAAYAVDIKDYHKEIMLGDNGKVDCTTCHGEQKRKTIPKAEVCESCHGSIEDAIDRISCYCYYLYKCSIYHVCVCV